MSTTDEIREEEKFTGEYESAEPGHITAEMLETVEQDEEEARLKAALKKIEERRAAIENRFGDMGYEVSTCSLLNKTPDSLRDFSLHSLKNPKKPGSTARKKMRRKRRN